MKYCRECGVGVRGEGALCPLCRSELLGPPEEGAYAAYPKIEMRSGKYAAVAKPMLYASLCVGLLCLFVNLITLPDVLWSLIVMTGILFLWETVGLMILSQKNIGLKLLAQMLAAMIVLITIDAVTGWRGWALGYVVPFVIIASSGAMTTILYIKRTQWREYMLFQLVIMLNGFIPVILFWCGLTNVLWPGAVGALYSTFSLDAMVIFFDKQVANELRKRFHV